MILTGSLMAERLGWIKRPSRTVIHFNRLRTLGFRNGQEGRAIQSQTFQLYKFNLELDLFLLRSKGYVGYFQRS